MNPAPNLVLVGPMGAGKTSVAKRLAALLGLEFVDADQRLEQIAGATVSVIFEFEGEAGFRQRETELLNDLMRGRGQVIATGGGAILSADTRELLKQRGFVVYIRVGIDQQLDRLARDHSRPLLAGGDRRQKLEELAALRQPLYEEVADLVFDSDGMAVAAAAKKVCAQVKKEWRREEAT
jgi:shikimate kinase